MRFLFITAAVLITLGLPVTGLAQLYMEDFEVDPTSAWTINDGPTDEYAEFHYDYSNLGIPSAPNSTGGSTHGMRLRANLIDGIFGGFSVSPTGQSFTGDYRLTFDFWHNYIGGFQEGVGVIGTTPGSTMLSLFGIETSGTTANYPGAADGIWFAATGDTSSSAFRAYSSERNVSYQLPIDESILDGEGNPVDTHATYLANTRSNNPSTGGGNEVYYQNAFPSVSVPAGQTSLYPDFQFGSTQPGTVGFAWHEVVIEKVGTMVTWTMDDTLLITLETEDFVTPTAGTNILFGHSDINDAVSTEDPFLEVAFTLIDNIKVEAIDDEGLVGDYNEDGKVDAADYVLWRKNPVAHGGDPDGYNDWVANFGEMASPGGGAIEIGAVPEPGTLAAALMGLLAVGACCRRRSE